MSVEVIGWDIGGAHLKAVALNEDGQVVQTLQYPCPLWHGLDTLAQALDRIAARLPVAQSTIHAITMTGELADLFLNRREGVQTLVERMRECFGSRLLVFGGPAGMLEPDRMSPEDLDQIASANWLASALWAAQRCQHGLLVDIGSTTTDVIPFGNGLVHARGYTDYERLRYDEMVYTGILRTPLMTIANSVPFRGHWVTLMNENFATAADVYRLTRELPEYSDQFPAADGGTKDLPGSARRLARMIGRDLESAGLDAWIELAWFFRESQVTTIARAVQLQISRLQPGNRAPLIGAGIGRFLVGAIGGRLGRDVIDVGAWLPVVDESIEFSAADCLPAAAVAYLAQSSVRTQ